MPKACATLWSALGAEATLGPLAEQRVQDAATWGQLPGGAQVTKSAPLFPRIEEPEAT
jgi:methionyl-tRNA synthetase